MVQRTYYYLILLQDIMKSKLNVFSNSVLPSWQRFMKSHGVVVMNRYDLDEVLKPFNAVTEIGDPYSDYIIFNSEEDKTFFILRWL